MCHLKLDLQSPRGKSCFHEEAWFLYSYNYTHSRIELSKISIKLMACILPFILMGKILNFSIYNKYLAFLKLSVNKIRMT